MKNFFVGLIIVLASLVGSNSAFAQSGPPAPGWGIYALIDTTYQVGTYSQGVSHAKITLKNSVTTKYTGVQFRLFYDKNAFASASVALIGSATNLDLQAVDNNANGYVTISLVYTGNSATYTIPDGERFDVTFTHVAPNAFFGLASISNLTWSGAQSYSQYASSQPGLDTVLTLHSYNGQWLRDTLKFHGTFTNVTGSPAKNLTLSLEKKVKIGGTWSQHAAYTTNLQGKFSIAELIDTTYYDVRLAIKGDTMGVGNVISTADAQLINQWILGNGTPQAWDFYTGDINGSNGLTITDAYGVFGRISGRFNSWPNGVKDLKFFTQAEYAAITGSPNTNYTATYTGTTNFYYNILPGQPDSVNYYVLVPGDANGTGYHMARLTPITILPTPNPNYPSQLENIIDMTAEYDFPTDHVEINMPSIKVTAGNLVEIPVTVKTFGKQISSLQLGMLYDSSALDFKELSNSDKSMLWLSSINPMDGIVEWSGYDPSANKDYMIPDGYNIFTLKFIAKQPQSNWSQSPLWTTRKFTGDANSKDMSVTPTNGILIVAKMAAPIGPNEAEESMIVYPNPTTGDFSVNFTVKNSGHVTLYILNNRGIVEHLILDKDMPEGNYVYSSNISNLASGLYIATLQQRGEVKTSKIIKE